MPTQDNAKLLEQLNLVINWNKYQSKISTERPNQYLDYLIDPSFQGVNRLFFVLSYKRYFLPTAEIKDYNVMIDGKNLFDQPFKNNLRTYDSI